MAAVHPTLQESAPALDSGAFYRLLADSIPVMVWTADAEGRVDFVNRRVLEYTGMQAQDLEGWNWESIIHPDDRDGCRENWMKALAAGEPSENEMRLRRADGVYRWHHGSGVPLRGRDGRVTRWFGICTDIDALRASEQRFQAFMDHLPANAWIRDAAFRYTYVNRRYARTWGGVEPRELDGRSAGEMFPSEIADYFRESDEQVRAQGAAIQYVDNEPSGRWLKVKFPVPDGSGGVAVGGMAVDITERSRLEEALAESERRFRSFMDHAPANAWIKDAALRFTYVNQRFSDYHGHRVQDVIGCDDFALFPADVATYFRAHDEEVRNGGVAQQTVRQMPRADGTLGHWLTVKFPFADASGAIGIAGFAIDVTARIDAEEKAQRYAEDVRSLVNRLVQAQEAERRRVADELHDLIGQNLTALGLDLQALKQQLAAAKGDGVAGPRLDTMATLVETTIDAIRGVMTDLRPPALEEFGLVPALRWYASVFSQRTGIKVATQASGRARRLSRDAELALFRIVQEALTNAAKHSGGTSVKIAIRYGDELRLTVEDDGRGFVDGAGARVTKRGGFGLTTMRERAEAFGGRFRIEFPGRGTRIVVEMPTQGEIPRQGNAD
jgi:PAS domain S-box-containing protein